MADETTIARPRYAATKLGQ